MTAEQVLPTTGDTQDPEFMAEWGGGKLRVLVDGRDYSERCRSFDVAAGTVECYLHNLDGVPFLLPDTEEPAMETLEGVVQVELVEDPPAERVPASY